MQGYIRTFMALSMLVLILVSCSSSPNVEDGGGAKNHVPVNSNSLVIMPSEVNLWFDTQGKPLGAYSVVLKYDPNIVQIAEVKGGESYFSGVPYVDKKDFQKGQVRIMAYHPHESGPAGQILVARIYFKAIQPGLAHLDLKVETLVNPQGDPIDLRPLMTTDYIRVTTAFRQ